MDRSFHSPQNPHRQVNTDSHNYLIPNFTLAAVHTHHKGSCRNSLHNVQLSLFPSPCSFLFSHFPLPLPHVYPLLFHLSLPPKPTTRNSLLSCFLPFSNTRLHQLFLSPPSPVFPRCLSLPLPRVLLSLSPFVESRLSFCLVCHILYFLTYPPSPKASRSFFGVPLSALAG